MNRFRCTHSHCPYSRTPTHAQPARMWTHALRPRPACTSRAWSRRGGPRSASSTASTTASPCPPAATRTAPHSSAPQSRCDCNSHTHAHTHASTHAHTHAQTQHTDTHRHTRIENRTHTFLTPPHAHRTAPLRASSTQRRPVPATSAWTSTSTTARRTGLSCRQRALPALLSSVTTALPLQATLPAPPLRARLTTSGALCRRAAMRPARASRRGGCSETRRTLAAASARRPSTTTAGRPGAGVTLGASRAPSTARRCCPPATRGSWAVTGRAAPRRPACSTPSPTAAQTRRHP